MQPTLALTLNLLLRGGTLLVLVLIAAALWRDHPRTLAARLGAVFALGVAASTLASAPGFSAAPTAWHAVISALASGSMFVFWLFTRALFDDTFEPSAWHAGVWGLLAGVGALQCAGLRRTW